MFCRSHIHCHANEILKVAMKKFCLHFLVCRQNISSQRCLPKELFKLILCLPCKYLYRNVFIIYSLNRHGNIIAPSHTNRPTTFTVKCKNPEFLQVVFDPPTERHAAAEAHVLGHAVLYKNCYCLRAADKQEQTEEKNK